MRCLLLFAVCSFRCSDRGSLISNCLKNIQHLHWHFLKIFTLQFLSIRKENEELLVLLNMCFEEIAGVDGSEIFLLVIMGGR
ncbi:hypothetical protein C5167_006578 [Papaver somniferum]|uniref:Uncharacterized protein n=1 Tax=Papaver somniferum TaxID=3469 RepID=A0A4Y7JGU9_PAPSO|nr:hypothetical protein C5167_006578 [Papaver somniferum]